MKGKGGKGGQGMGRGWTNREEAVLEATAITTRHNNRQNTIIGRTE